MIREKSCGAVTFCKIDGQLCTLLIRHVNGGHWSFPKGHVEAGESERQTAQREILEETGLNVQVDTGFRQMNSYSPRKDIFKDVIYFVAVSDTQQVIAQQEEVSRIKWVEVHQALDCITYPVDKNILRQAVEYYNNKYNKN